MLAFPLDLPLLHSAALPEAAGQGRDVLEAGPLRRQELLATSQVQAGLLLVDAGGAWSIRWVWPAAHRETVHPLV